MRVATLIQGRDRFKLMLVRPPAHLWPLVNESDNFLLPLGLPAMAAYLRREMKGVEIKILDCLPDKVGWKSLEKAIADFDPDVFGVGDMVIYMHEGMKAAALAKKVKPSVITLGGGHFHSHMPRYSLGKYPQLDFIVRYEGEETTREFLETLRAGGDISQVQSIAYRDGEQIVETPPRPLIASLDTLPMPAYDLMPINKYSPFGVMWPKTITIQGNRGCPYNCSYCSWSAMEGEHVLGPDGRHVLIPTIRQRSAHRVIEDIDLLYGKYGIRYLFWVEGTWNFDNDWLNDFCDQMLKRNYKGLGWWAFVRADKLLEQEKLGILSKMVKVGLRHVLIGGERPVDEELAEIGKTKLSGDALMQASHLLKRKYPQVFRMATWITGIRSETPASMMRLSDYTIRAKLDFTQMHPLMPFPGTPLYEEALQKGWITEPDFGLYDMFHPILRGEHMTAEEISHYTAYIQLRFVRKQPLRFLAGLFSPHKIRRRIKRYLMFSVLKLLARDAYLSLKGEKKFEGFGAVGKLWKPAWYDT